MDAETTAADLMAAARMVLPLHVMAVVLMAVATVAGCAHGLVPAPAVTAEFAVVKRVVCIDSHNAGITIQADTSKETNHETL